VLLVRPATLLFFAFATFTLGVTAVALGAGTFVASLFGIAAPTAVTAFLALTIGLAALYVLLAVYYALTEDLRARPDDDGSD
jgi:hypothetical protein